MYLFCLVLPFFIILLDVCPYPMPDVSSSSVTLTVNPSKNGPNEPWQALSGSKLSYTFTEDVITLTAQLNTNGPSETDYVAFMGKNMHPKNVILKVTNEVTMTTTTLTNPVSLQLYSSIEQPTKSP